MNDIPQPNDKGWYIEARAGNETCDLVIRKSENVRFIWTPRRGAAVNVEAETFVQSLLKRIADGEKLLEKAYQSGHREGWEPGPSTTEVMGQIHDHLCNVGKEPKAK